MKQPTNTPERADVLEQLKAALAQGDKHKVNSLLGTLHPADIARIMESMPQGERVPLWARLAADVRGEVLLELHGEARAQLIKQADASALIAAVLLLEGDELADLDAHLPPEILEAALRVMDKPRQHRYQQIRNFPNDTAGGLMDADAVADRDLISAPVVDRQGRLIGRITVDDVVDVIRAEGEQRILAPAGLSAQTDLFAPVIASAKPRALWLGVHLLGAFAAAAVIALFEQSIERIVALAVLMPVVATMAVINGALWGTVMTVVAFLWFDHIGLALVFGASMLITLLVVVWSGALIPVAMSRRNIDPAVAGTVVVVAIADVIGFTVFLGFATLFLI